MLIFKIVSLFWVSVYTAHEDLFRKETPVATEMAVLESLPQCRNIVIARHFGSKCEKIALRSKFAGAMINYLTGKLQRSFSRLKF